MTTPLDRVLRLIFRAQLDILEATFQQHRYPSIDTVDDLVEQLNLPTQKITVGIVSSCRLARRSIFS